MPDDALATHPAEGPTGREATMEVLALTRFGAEDLERLVLPRPVAGPGQVLVRNHAAGVNVIDLLIRRGGVLAPGDRVLWFGMLGAGGYGSSTAVDASCVAKIADDVPFAMAAAAPVAYATARNLLFTYGAPEPGAWVLVHSAAGGVGVAALRVARNAGLRTIALTTPGKFGFVLAQGAAAAVDWQASDWVEQVRAATGGQGVALSLNSVAGTTLAQDLGLLAPFGQVVSFGHLGGPPQGPASDLLMPFFSKSVGIRVSDIYTLWGARRAALSAMLRAIADDLASGAITASGACRPARVGRHRRAQGTRVGRRQGQGRPAARIGRTEAAPGRMEGAEITVFATTEDCS